MVGMPMIDHGKRSDPPMRGPKKKKVRALRGESYAPTAGTGIISLLSRLARVSETGTFGGTNDLSATGWSIFDMGQACLGN